MKIHGKSMGFFIVGRTMKMCLFLFGSRGLAWMVWCQIHWIFMEISEMHEKSMEINENEIKIQ